MNIVKLSLSILAFLCLQLIASAQPDLHHGCRHAHNKVKLQPLTMDQMFQMASDDARSDTIDILNYTINLEILNVSISYINANCEVMFSSKMDNVNSITLDLLDLTVDSVLLSGNPITYTYDGLKLKVDLPTMNTGDTETVIVYYNGSPEVDPSAFGGLAFSNGYAYNLGIGLSSNPPNFGRSWHPCFDSFVERSTFEYNITTKGNNRAFCVGTFIGEETVQGDTIVRTYRMDQQIPTYLSSIAVSNYVTSNSIHNGLNGEVPIQLIARPNNINDMSSTFVDLGQAIDALEYWYGPYQWERVGYVATPVGAMEHPTNIAYPTGFAFDGNSFAHRRLMSHELAHCWFGNVATVGSPSDMWFKEGNAEYGAHLMTEYAYGYDSFIDQVKDNHLVDVLRNAHVNDEGFHPLSGMPFEWTYGVTTYNKGAAMIHNLRGYLGDSLFRIGQQAVLADYQYKSVSGEEYRDALINATGYDLVPFFDDLIFQPGFTAFEINQVSSAQSGSNYAVDIELEQKLRGCPNLHTNVPLEITIIDEQLNRHSEIVTVTADPTTNISITSPVQPAHVLVNESNRLNMAHMSHNKTLDAFTGSVNMPYVDLDLNIQEIVDPTWIHIDHYWVGADPIMNNPDNAEISSTHYWRVLGEFPDGFHTKGVFEYNDLLDAELVDNDEEGLIVLYRAGGGYDWQEYDNYTHIPILPTDGTGFMRIDSLIPGEYALGKGTIGIYTSNKEIEAPKNDINIYPNPTADIITLEFETDNIIEQVNIEIIDATGKSMLNKNVPANNNYLQHTINLSEFPEGIYWTILKDKNGVLLGAESIEKITN